VYSGAPPDSDAGLTVEDRPFQGRVGKGMASNAALKRRSSTKLPSAERLSEVVHVAKRFVFEPRILELFRG